VVELAFSKWSPHTQLCLIWRVGNELYLDPKWCPTLNFDDNSFECQNRNFFGAHNVYSALVHTMLYRSC
jgi:hypothetical protein